MTSLNKRVNSGKTLKTFILVSLNPQDSNLGVAILDVSASLQLTHTVLSFNPQTLNPTTTTVQQIIPSNLTSSSSFSLLLHSRDSLLTTNHSDYKSLFVSRLARNSNRVNSLNVKLQLKLSNIHKSDLRPVETEIRPEDLSTPIISVVSQGSGEYFARIRVGTPANQCKPCSDCCRLEIYWKQRSRVNWLKSAKFFHHKATAMKKNNLIRSITLADGSVASGISSLLPHFVDFYTQLYTTQGEDHNAIALTLKGISNRIHPHLYSALERPYTEDEV
ncbi:protein ASPARTIC PROTEASE IN GUARD CELL 1-like [Cannabis sativa]|uniref:protein ASPARTIC PROTEASE IN GUARD CELL 1-like n=1 Tax=Cannabis sativa TaxID=3483 RepID=UPI0029CA6E94|nr:protein ASPARTIC PROTEASE IN GUARD CELL 1-like [Cannabis sativa]